MKSVHVTGPGQIEVIDGPEPALEADEVMLRPITATLASDDVRRVYDGAAGGYPLPAGASAHELVARVVEAKYNAREWREYQPGELVAFYGTQAIGLAETVVVPHSTVYWLPPAEDPDLQAVPTARPLGQVIEACNTFPPLTTACAAVVGQGSSGLLFDALLARMGAGVVAGIDTRPERVAAAGRFGADAGARAGRGHGAPGSGCQRRLPGRRGGGDLRDHRRPAACRRAGPPRRAAARVRRPQRVAVPPGRCGARREALRGAGIGSRHRGSEPYWSPYGAAMNLVLRGEVDTRPMLTHRFPLEQAAKAFELARSGDDGALKVSIDFGDGG